MRIALVVGLDKETSLHAKGGSEVWAALYAREMTRRGHTVVLYAPGGSRVEGVQLFATLPHTLSHWYGDPYFADISVELFSRRKEEVMATLYARTVAELFLRKDTYDIIVDSVAHPSFTCAASVLTKPLLSIGHFPSTFGLDFYASLLGWSSHHHVVFPSRYQAQQTRGIPPEKSHVIPHGIEVESFAFNPQGGACMVWMSRVHARMDKGIVAAMQLAHRTQHPLFASGYIEKSSRAYFKKRVQPLVYEPVSFAEQLPDARVDKSILFGDAKLFLFPLQWEEPFGFVLVEALACGTPVVAYARGALPEILEDGVTGFLVNPSASDLRGDFVVKKTGPRGLAEAIERLYALSEPAYSAMRAHCRKAAETRYQISTMAAAYEKLQTALIGH